MADAAAAAPPAETNTNKENNNPLTPRAPSPKKKKPLKQGNSKKKKTKAVPTVPDTKQTTAKRVAFSAEDDRIMVETLLEQKVNGFATDNGGWRDPALKAVVNALAGSELTSGGAPKTVRSVRDHWGQVHNTFVFYVLISNPVSFTAQDQISSFSYFGIHFGLGLGLGESSRPGYR